MQILGYVVRYGGSGLVHSVPYFCLNELVTTGLDRRGIDNFFLSHSLSAFALMPLFAMGQHWLRTLPWKESRLLSYRYLGTLCCASLICEAALALRKYWKLTNKGT